MKKHLVFLVISLLSFVFAPLSSIAQVPSYVPTSGLVGWWPFNGNANDESGNGNNGTVNGATLTTDRFGVANKAYSFNGTTNFISVPHSASLNLSVPSSFSMWIKIPSYPVDGNEHYFLSKFSQGPGVSMKGIHMAVSDYNNSDIIFCRYRDDVSSNWGGTGFSNSLLPQVGNWFNIVFVCDATSDRMYLNGTLINTSIPSAVLGSNTASLLFGKGQVWSPSTDMPFQGMMDDIAIYNRALTQQEITNLYTSSVPPTLSTSASPSLINCGESATLTAISTSAVQPCVKADLPATLQNGLVGYWPFCGNANDASGNGNNGTVNGSTLTTDRFGNASSAYSFDGASNHIVVQNSTILNNLNSLTLSYWVNVVNFPSVSNVISGTITKWYQTGSCGSNTDHFGTWITYDNRIVGGTRLYSALGTMPQTNSTVLQGNWYHVVFTHNTAVGGALYVNGVLISTLNTSGSLCTTTNNLFFGCDNMSGSLWRFLNGKLDDIAIYSRALSASEVQQLYTLGNVTYSWSTGATTPSITVTPAQTSTYNCTATNSSGSTTSSVTVTLADTLTWTGLYDTDWHKPCNWSPQFVPKCCNNVAVPLSTNQPIVSGVAAAEDLTIYTTNGAQITVNNGANIQIATCPTTITTTSCPSLAVITTTAVSSITQSTAVSGGTISYQGASAITARGVCWGTSPNPTIANSLTSNGTGIGTFTSNLTGLVVGTTYYVRAYATNGSGTSYGNQVSFVAVNPQPAYPTNSVFCASGPTLVVDVTNPTTGKTWMDRNLGATQVATSSTDAAAYGDLYQWGRGNDGHQCRTSATTTTLSSSDQPGNGNFILAPNSPNDWRSPQNVNLWQGVNGVNNPCPSGYRVPTEIELNNERLSWSANNVSGAFASLLKWPMAGVRDYSGVLITVGVTGGYWASTVSGSNTANLSFDCCGANMLPDGRSGGFTVRCIKDASAIPATLGALNCVSTSITGTLTSGTAASGVSASVPYTVGNGGSYAAQTISSTGVTGLTATLSSGILANGSGSLSLVISGTPSTSGTASFALTIGGQNCSFTVSVQTALAAQYPANSVFCASGPTAIVDVTNPTTGKIWMDRNLGASQVATSSTDAAAYGDLYQWGRGNDGHQCRTSATTTTLSSTDQPGNGNFILAPNAPNDWRSPQNVNLWQGVNGINNPCPSGYRVPTDSEIDMERASWVSQNNSGAFLSVLKLVTSGIRNYNNGLVSASSGNYWTSTISGIESRNIQTSPASIGTALRGYGLSVRCIKDASAIPATIGAINCGSSSITGTLTSGTAASGVSASVPYTGGNGGSYAAQTISSTGVTGLTATLSSGILANGSGSLSLVISGTPSTSGTASFALTIGGQSCSFTVSVQTALAAQYPANSVFCASGPTLIVDVTNPATGKIWMDRNLGASQVATSSTDAAAYGDLYQWGRATDGHQCRTSATTTALSSSDQPGNANFILAPNTPIDWRSPQNDNLWQGVNGVNNPCPSGYRLPTQSELEAERLSWNQNNSIGAFASPLKFSNAGYRNGQNALLGDLGTDGRYWTSSINNNIPAVLNYGSGGALIDAGYRASGRTVRCIKN